MVFLLLTSAYPHAKRGCCDIIWSCVGGWTSSHRRAVWILFDAPGGQGKCQCTSSFPCHSNYETELISICTSIDSCPSNGSLDFKNVRETDKQLSITTTAIQCNSIPVTFLLYPLHCVLPNQSLHITIPGIVTFYYILLQHKLHSMVAWDMTMAIYHSM